ncbi:MAG: N-acetylmuramoyl-L-alanine amidase [Geitlerinemataceae cyanobacterium]
MNPFSPLFCSIGLATLGAAIAFPVMAQQPLSIVYPPPNHETTADRIFLIGTAAADGEVTVNGETIERSPAGHFAPSFPLQIGENRFVIRYQNQELQWVVTRKSTQPILPQGIDFAKGSLLPVDPIARMPGESICFEAIAPADSTVSVQLANRSVTLLPQSQSVALPANNAVLTGNNQPETQTIAGLYQGCTSFNTPGNLGTPVFQLELNGTVRTQAGSGAIEILSSDRIEVAEVIVEGGVARTGPGTDYSRLTPLPKGTQAAITAKEGEWLRLDYGAWIKASEVQVFPTGTPPRSLIRSVRASHGSPWTEVFFPLQVPVPVSIVQDTDTLTLTLHNTTAQTDTIAFNDNPIVSWMDWQQVSGDLQYTFHFKSQQQWGYKLRYDGTTLVLSLRHPPKLLGDVQSLAGVTVLLDPGHGSDADLGAVGPNGYPEKEVALRISQLLRDRLQARGATVVMTREGDEDILPGARADRIAKVEPTIALSLHYNALPDSGDAMNTAGIGTFWYQPQAHDLATFLYNYLVEDLNRPAYGVFWGNLALARPAVTPSVLLELGFMINPVEFEWIVDPAEQEKLADSLAEGITQWIHSRVE